MCGCLLRNLYGDLAHNPGMCPDWESNQQPFGLQACTQSTEPHQPGPVHHTVMRVRIYPQTEKWEMMAGFLLLILSSA